MNEPQSPSHRVAYAVTHDDPPQVLIAVNESVLTRLVALEVVAKTHPDEVGHHLGAIRAALLEERWDEAVATWIEATGTSVDAFPDEVVWAEADLDSERTALELRVAPIFEDHADGG